MLISRSPIKLRARPSLTPNAQWDQIHKKLNFKKSLNHLEKGKNMNFCALKITKNEIFGPRKFKIEKLGVKNS